MSVYDEVICKYPLPIPVQNKVFQTYRFDDAYHNYYEIREDGTLWREYYDVEDRSDPNAEGFAKLIGAATRVNKQWIPVIFTGEIVLISDVYDFSVYFVRGELKFLVQINN